MTNTLDYQMISIFQTPREGMIYGIVSKNPIILLGIAVFVLIRILLVFRVLKDISSRTNRIGIQILSVVLVILLTPLLGLPIYLVFRPKFYYYDNILWREALVSSLLECSNCKMMNHQDHNVCVACGEVLKISCRECQKKYSYLYHYCPDCGAPNID